MSAFVMVHLGSSVPDYLADCFFQIRCFNPSEAAYLICDGASDELQHLTSRYSIQTVNVNVLPASPGRVAFESQSKLDRNWRGGFNYFAVKRFFLIEEFMKLYGVSDVVHIEYDNAIYFCLDGFVSQCRSVFHSLGLVLDNDRRCIPGIVYIRNDRAIEDFNVFYVEKCLGKMENDMAALALFHFRQGNRRQLPIAMRGILPRLFWARSHNGMVARRPWYYWELADHFGGIFDAAAIGQYLGGIDPRNAGGSDTRGFINESCIFSPDDLSITWKTDASSRLAPFASFRGGREYRIFNLHVHSKNLNGFLSLQREEDQTGS